MNKIKLLTSLTSLGAICIATPVVTTSCSNNGSSTSIGDVGFSTGNNCKLENLTSSIKVAVEDTSVDAIVNLSYHGKSDNSVYFKADFSEAESNDTVHIDNKTNQLVIPRETLSQTGSVIAFEQLQVGELQSWQEVPIIIEAKTPETTIILTEGENCWISSDTIASVNIIDKTKDAKVNVSLKNGNKTEFWLTNDDPDNDWGSITDGVWTIPANTTNRKDANIKIGCNNKNIPNINLNADTPINITGTVTYTEGDPDKISPSGKTTLKNVLVAGDTIEFTLNNSEETVQHWCIQIPGVEHIDISDGNIWTLTEEQATQVVGKLITVKAYKPTEVETEDASIATLQFKTANPE